MKRDHRPWNIIIFEWADQKKPDAILRTKWTIQKNTHIFKRVRWTTKKKWKRKKFIECWPFVSVLRFEAIKILSNRRFFFIIRFVFYYDNRCFFFVDSKSWAFVSGSATPFIWFNKLIKHSLTTSFFWSVFFLFISFILTF